MSIQKLLFRYRSYTPIPFLIVMAVWAEPNPTSMIIGFLIAACGELLRAWGVAHAGSETRTTSGVGASRLVTSGPFGHVRNPLYLGNLSIYTGIGIMSFALFPYLQVAAILYFFVQYALIVREEEEFLHKTFGAEYAEYFRSVPRFVPNFKPYGHTDPAPPDWRKGLRSESRTLQAFILVALLLVTIWVIR